MKIQRKIKVLVVEPNELPKIKEIPNTLSAKQQIVDGYIEYTYLENENDIAIICNEEGKINGLPLNRDIGYDIIAGTFIIVGDDGVTGEDRSLNEEQIEKYTKYFDEKSIKRTKQKLIELYQKDNYEI